MTYPQTLVIPIKSKDAAKVLIFVAFCNSSINQIGD